MELYLDILEEAVKEYFRKVGCKSLTIHARRDEYNLVYIDVGTGY